MSLLLLKLLVTPALMYGVSLASRRWGSSVGGLLSGLPITSAPVSIFLTLEDGPRFASSSALGSITGLTAVILFYAVYFLVSRVAGVLASLAASLAVYVAGASLFAAIHDRLDVLIAIFLAVAIGIIVASVREKGSAQSFRPPRWDMPARIVVSTGMLLAITIAAPKLGPTATGILAPIPVIAWPLTVFSHVQQGRPEAVMAIRGNVQTSIGLLAFFIVVANAVPAHPFGAYVRALLVAVAFAAPWFWLSFRARNPIQPTV